MAIDGVVAEVGLPADEPFAERRTGVVQDLRERLVPVHELCLLGPEAVALGDGTAIKLPVARHGGLSLLAATSASSPGWLSRCASAAWRTARPRRPAWRCRCSRGSAARARGPRAAPTWVARGAVAASPGAVAARAG